MKFVWWVWVWFMLLVGGEGGCEEVTGLTKLMDQYHYQPQEWDLFLQTHAIKPGSRGFVTVEHVSDIFNPGPRGFYTVDPTPQYKCDFRTLKCCKTIR